MLDPVMASCHERRCYERCRPQTSILGLVQLPVFDLMRLVPGLFLCCMSQAFAVTIMHRNSYFQSCHLHRVTPCFNLVNLNILV